MRVRTAALALYAIFCVYSQARFAASLIYNEFTEPERVRYPLYFDLWNADDRVNGLNAEARAAGIHIGDRILTVDGWPFTGEKSYARALARHRPGDTLRLVVQPESGGALAERTVVLQQVASPEGRWNWPDWIYVLVRGSITPLLAICLGFFVVFRRMADPFAWIVLAMMLSFSQHATGGLSTGDRQVFFLWEDGFHQIALWHRIFWWGLWPASIVLFAIYFPYRARFDARYPNLKWLLITPVVSLAGFVATAVVSGFENIQIYAPLVKLAGRSNNFRDIVFYTAVAALFGILFQKWRNETRLDARRRLRLLFAGTLISFLPGVTIGAVQTFTSLDVPVTAWVSASAFWLLFPVTLTYLIVVQRAMDVQVVLRQGIQYALARRGVVVLQIFFSAVIVLWLAASTERFGFLARAVIIAAGIAAVVLFGLIARHLATWIDRRFFREQYHADRVLTELAASVNSIVDPKQLLSTVATRIAETMHVLRVALFLRGSNEFRLAYAIGYSDLPPPEIDSSSPLLHRLSREWRPLPVYTDEQFGSQLLVPLARQDKLLGLLSLGAKRSEEPYSPSDLRLLESIATQTALALENGQLAETVARETAQREVLNRELEIAKEVQERLFPQSYPELPGLDYAGACRPARHVGGDYYDFFELPNSTLGIAIGDIAGKGISAALLMASLHAALRGQVLSGVRDLAQVMSNVNQLLFDATPANRYATLFLAQLDLSRRILVYVNGGHNAPMLLRPDGSIMRLDEGGSVAGLFRQAQFSASTVKLSPGDMLIAFTDGITEAMNAAEEEFDEDRLLECVRTSACVPVKELMTRIFASVDAFVAGAPQHDDMTVAVLRVKE